MTNQNKINQINRLHGENYQLKQEIDYLKSQFVDGDIAGNKCRIKNLEIKLQASQTNNEIVLEERNTIVAEYLCRIQNLETQLQASQEENTKYKVLLGQKDETIREYLREIKKMNRTLDSNQKFSKIFSVIVYSITIWILNS